MTRKPSILMFGWEFPPLYSGGLGIACLGLTHALTEFGARVIFVLPGFMNNVSADYMRVLLADGSAGESEVRDDFRMYRIPSLLAPYDTEESYLARFGDSIAHSAYQAESTLQEEVIRYARHARAIALRETFDVIHAHDWLTYLAGLEAKRATGRPLVLHVHSTEFDRTGGQGGNAFVMAIERQALSEADAIIAISHYTKNVVMREYGVDPAKITVIHNGVQANVHADHTAVSALDTLRCLKQNGAQIVLSLGRLTIQKGLDYFLLMAKRVLEYLPDTYFIVAGSGDMERALMQQAASLGITHRVFFPGFFRGNQVEEAYRMADLFVVPSVSEPFGLTVLESMAHGTPVIVSKQSGVSEIVIHALKADFWDVDAMADQTIAVLRHAPLRHQLSEQGARETTHFTWHEAAKKCLALFARLGE